MYVLVSLIVLFGVTLNYNAGGQPVAATSYMCCPVVGCCMRKEIKFQKRAM